MTDRLGKPHGELAQRRRRQLTVPVAQGHAMNREDPLRTGAVAALRMRRMEYARESSLMV